MATLFGQQIDLTYQGLIKTVDNGALGATEKSVTDGLGNASTLSLGTASASFTGTLDLSGATVTGLPVDPNTTYDLASAQDAANVNINLTGSDATVDTVKLVAGTNITLTNVANEITIDASGGGGAAGLVAGTTANSMRSADALTTLPTTANGTATIAIGNGATATGTNNVSIGQQGRILGGGNNTILNSNNSQIGLNSQHNIIIGGNGLTIPDNINDNIVMGRVSGAPGAGSSNCVQIGIVSQIGTSCEDSTAVGRQATVANSASNATAIGARATVNNGGGVAVGQEAVSSGASSVSIGRISTTAETESVAIGRGATATRQQGIAIGPGASTAGSGIVAIAIGRDTIANNSRGVAIGMQTQSLSENSIALGDSSRVNASANGSVALGRAAIVNANHISSVAIGDNAVVNGQRSVAIGRNTTTGPNSVALGNHAGANAAQSIAIACSSISVNTVNANASLMIVPGPNGCTNPIAAINSITIGSSDTQTARVTQARAIAIGYQATATAEDAVALGPNIVAATANTVTINRLQILDWAAIDYVDDTAAAAGGIPLGGVYHNAGALRIRIV